MNPGQRKLLMSFLVSAFVIQTSLVYTDDTSLQTPPLSEEALAGRTIWHENNCQACHQLYGFGGFLGPDLTNAAPRLTRERLDEILTVGSGQMPAFGFEPEEIDAIETFLIEMDETGVGQARKYAPQIDLAQVDQMLDQHSTEGTLSGDAAEGRFLFRTRCASCHQLFKATPLGPFMAPDLTDVMDRLPEADVAEVIKNGRPERGMVPPPLSEEERADVMTFLTWLRDTRSTLKDQLGIGEDSQSLPWFEFK